ncbi:hypothetical protein ACHAPM_011125 [Fusarium culmorum]
MARKNAEAVELDDHSTSEVAVDESVEDVDFVTDVEYEDLVEDDDDHGDDSNDFDGPSDPNDAFPEDYLTSATQEGMIETQAMFSIEYEQGASKALDFDWALISLPERGQWRPNAFMSTANSPLFPELNGLTHGDSGSIVIDARTNVVYGHVVASNPLEEIYISPIGATLEQIQSHFPGSKVSLPDPLTLLTGLATFGHETIGRQSTWHQADSPAPLSSVKEESGLGKLARSSAEPAPSRPLLGPSILVVISQSTGRELYSNGVTEAALSSKISDEAEADSSIKPDSDAASPTDCRIIGHLRTRPAGLERDLSSTYNAALSKFPSFQNDMIGMNQDPEELTQQDIFPMQVWSSLSTLKQRLPNQERMENLTWRMMHINLRKLKEQEEPR